MTGRIISLIFGSLNDGVGHMIYYDGRLFRPVLNSDSGEVSGDTVFRYKQRENILTGEYSGGDIQFGQLIGLVDEKGQINMRYQHVNAKGILMTGKCRSRPEWTEDGKLRLLERWQWTCGSRMRGTSTLEEL